MRRSILASIALSFAATLLMAQEKAENSDFQFKSGQSVYVIAGKSRAPSNKNFWQTLNREIPKRYAVPLPPLPNNDNISGRPTLEKALPERATLDRAEPIRRVLPPEAPKLKKQIEGEILKQKKFSLAESPEQADFILFANGDYVHTYFITRPGMSGGTINPGGGDSEIGPTLARVSVAAIPATAYRRWHSHFSELFTMAKWHDESWGKVQMEDHSVTLEEPSVQKLIQQFHKQALKK